MVKKYDIEKNIIENAKNTAAKINSRAIRKRAYALNIGANFVTDCLCEKELDVKNKFSLHKTPSFSRELELADIYIDGFRFDVRVIFEGKYFYVPKSHKLFDAIPSAYIVVKLEKDLTKAELLGFVSAEKLVNGEDFEEYIAYDLGLLQDIEEFKDYVETLVPDAVEDESAKEKIEELSAGFIDDEISESEKVFFIKHVINCSSCREVFCELSDFDSVVVQLKDHEDLLDDSTLSILSGNIQELAVEAEAENLDSLFDMVDEHSEEEQEEVPFLIEEEVVEPEAEMIPEEVFEEPVGEILEGSIEEIVEEAVEQVDEMPAEPVEEPVEEFNLEEKTLHEEIEPLELEDLEVLDGLNEESVEEHTDQLVVEGPPLEEIAEHPLEELHDMPLEELHIEEEHFSLEEETPIENMEEIHLEEIHEEPLEEIKETIVDEIVEETVEEKIEESIEEITEEPVEEHIEQAPAVDSEIQNLLDDDLLAILSENTEEPVKAEEEVFEETVEPVELIEETEPEPVKEFEAILSEQPQAEAESSMADLSELQDDDSETIESLFDNSETSRNEEEGGVLDLNNEPVSASTVNATKKAIVAGVAALVLAGAGAGYWFMNNAKNQEASNETGMDGQNNEVFDMQNKGSNENAETPPAAQDINKAMTNSFSDKPAAITITKISWQISEKLVADPSVKEYLQAAGKNIQMNLQSDLANAADVTFNNSVKVSFEVAQDNTLKGMQMLESSGSDKIDAIIQSSLKNTLKYVPVPKIKDFKGDYFLTIVINF